MTVELTPQSPKEKSTWMASARRTAGVKRQMARGAGIEIRARSAGALPDEPAQPDVEGRHQQAQLADHHQDDARQHLVGERVDTHEEPRRAHVEGIEGSPAEHQDHRDGVRGHGSEEQVEDLPRLAQTPPGGGRGGTHHGPPEERAAGHEGQVLEHVDALRADRHLVERRDVPGAHDDREDQLGGDRLGHRPEAGDPLQRPYHRGRQRQQQERWRHEPDEHVLEHVDALQVVVADGVHRGLQGQPDGQDAEQEVERLLPAEVPSPAGEDSIAEAEQGEARVDGGVEGPAHSGLAAREG
jgi:hypothetical protein